MSLNNISLMKKIFLVGLIFIALFFIGCITPPPQFCKEPSHPFMGIFPCEAYCENKSEPFSGCVPGQDYCEQDSDCACGVNVETRDCFLGNKHYVDISEQCPDFCTGIAGHLRVKCVENECKSVPLSE